MTIQELVSELDKIYHFTQKEVDTNNGSEIALKGEELTRLLPRCYMIAARLEAYISDLKEEFIKDNELHKKEPPVIVKEAMIDAHLSELTAQYKRANGYVKTIENTLDFYRTLLSYLKTELNNLK